MAATKRRHGKCKMDGVAGYARMVLLGGALAVLPSAAVWADDPAPTVDQDMAGVPDETLSDQQDLLLQRAVAQPAKSVNAAGTSPNAANVASAMASGEASAGQRLDADSSAQE